MQDCFEFESNLFFLFTGRIFDSFLCFSVSKVVRESSSKLLSNLMFSSILRFIRVFWIVETFLFTGFQKKRETCNRNYRIECSFVSKIGRNHHRNYRIQCSFVSKILRNYWIQCSFVSKNRKRADFIIEIIEFNVLSFPKIVREQNHHRNYHRIQCSFISKIVKERISSSKLLNSMFFRFQKS